MPQVLTLSVGFDLPLLESRNELLKEGGYTVISAHSVPEAASKFLGGDFDVVILCHSIPSKGRRYLANLMHGHSPFTPMARLSVGHRDAALYQPRSDAPE